MYKCINYGWFSGPLRVNMFTTTATSTTTAAATATAATTCFIFALFLYSASR
jgi:hypothetical protein